MESAGTAADDAVAAVAGDGAVGAGLGTVVDWTRPCSGIRIGGLVGV